MVISESQLVTWSHQGAEATAKATHESIRAAIEAQDWPLGTEYEVYLQGSYRNSTNIRGDSDVDVVVQLNSSLRHDLSLLSAGERELFKLSFSDATYTWGDFKADVLRALRGHYRLSVVDDGKKAIRVDGTSGRLPADVVVCLHFRKYLRFITTHDQRFIEGMTFYVPSESRWIVNYPKVHYENGVAKNSKSRTNEWYKPTVRVFKNARTYLVDRGKISQDLAPSYFLECLFYNVPDDCFGKTYVSTCVNSIDWILKSIRDDSFREFKCQNEQMLLFGNSPEQWSSENAVKFLGALLNLLNAW